MAIEGCGFFDQRHTPRVTQGLHDLLNRLTAAVAAEYEREVGSLLQGPAQRLAERVDGLLARTSSSTSGIDYTFADAWHVCIVAVGANGRHIMDALAATLGRQLLTVARGDELLWAWLGGKRQIAVAEIATAARREPLGDMQFALSESAHGLDGWRLTYRQARAALRVALRDTSAITTFADAALAAALLCDEALAESYVETFLSPLNAFPDRGARARESLRAYFEAGHRLQSAAQRLELDRSTLRRRLRTTEDALGYELREHQAELEVALRLERLFNRGRASADLSSSGPALRERVTAINE